MIKAYINYFIPASIHEDADEYRRAFQLTTFTQLSLLFFCRMSSNGTKWALRGWRLAFSAL